MIGWSGLSKQHYAMALAVAAVIVSSASGCIPRLFEVPEQQRKAAALAIVSGTVASEYESHRPLIVGLVGESAGRPVLVDHFVSEGPGPWFFVAEPGAYRLAAFEDANNDGSYDDEPALRIDRGEAFTLTAGQRKDGIALTIPRDGRFEVRRIENLAELQARDPESQQRSSLGALTKVGEIVSLSDPLFDRANAELGLWRYYDFLLQVGAGVYFLQEFDPDKVPVLFVHGVNGTPRDFEQLIGALDQRRFQPWVFYYPSGARLEGVGTVLSQLLVRLGWQYRFKEIVVVAHSMGGLVARYTVLQYHDLAGSSQVKAFVTISSPFGGMESAALAVEKSPIVVHSWRDVAEGSAFLRGLFFSGDDSGQQRRRLPKDVQYTLLFGYRASRGGSSDGVVRVASQLRPEAQEEAHSMRGYDEDHTSILRSPEVASELGNILEVAR